MYSGYFVRSDLKRSIDHSKRRRNGFPGLGVVIWNHSAEAGVVHPPVLLQDLLA